ncbi:T-cell immunoglobulin and mucin domain-containing protein 4 isoform X2 [Ochotona curzoniae]|uniref:T-cell immunoglobulin and mucin domain-containing protein 4 isoform X2 n=1 Tax=Ochotona curzoniae TaxID=130825 RepID=UPI001B34E4F7|nr:T-cell immunoglobulin and mucin domain-containing protein 4 isoform X2 [Ochotona curzoniae]
MGYGQTDRLLGLLAFTMSRRLLIFWLAIGIKWLYLTSAASEIVQTGVLGKSVTLPCTHSSWSRSSNSMCWGRGPCPNSKCNQEILHTDGTKVTSPKSSKYRLLGNIQRGDVSLTIFNTNEDDSGVYCCRIEVPGWFNDVKRNVRLQLKRAPTTTRRTTTSRPTTTPRLTTTTTVLPTTVGTNPDLTSGTTLQTTTALLTTVTTTPPATTLASLPETSTGPLTTGTEGPILAPESETFFASGDSWTSVGITSAGTPLLSSKASEAWVLSSTFRASTQQMNVSMLEGSEIAVLDQNEERVIVDPNEKEKSRKPIVCRNTQG